MSQRQPSLPNNHPAWFCWKIPGRGKGLTMSHSMSFSSHWKFLLNAAGKFCREIHLKISIGSSNFRSRNLSLCHKFSKNFPLNFLTLIPGVISWQDFPGWQIYPASIEGMCVFGGWKSLESAIEFSAFKMLRWLFLRTKFREELSHGNFSAYLTFIRIHVIYVGDVENF